MPFSYRSHFVILSSCHLVILWYLGFSATASAAEALTRIVVPGESSATGRRMMEADRLATERRWPEAVAEYQRILDEVGDDLVAIDAGRSVQARLLCRERFAALPPEALRLYRDKVDSRAQKWLDQALAERDSRWLLKIVDEAFASRAGERAIDLLGDWAFERGDFDAAGTWWRLLTLSKQVGQVPAPWESGGASRPLMYPEPHVDLARLGAKQVLARWFGGDINSRDALLAAYRGAHSQAAGSLAGRKGKYTEILDELTSEPPAARPMSWTTFAGAPTRDGKAASSPRLLHQPTWSSRLGGQQLPQESAARIHKVATPRAQAQLLAYHPVVAGDQVLVADAHTVLAFAVRTGERAVWYDLLTDPKLREDELPPNVSTQPGQRYTLTLVGDRVYARLGAAPSGTQKQNTRGGIGASYVVCLRQKPDAQGRRACWAHRAGKNGTVTEFFEGAPVVHDGRVYVAVTRIDAGASVRSIACYEAESGAPCWQRPVDLCEIRDIKPAEPRLQHELLTLAGSQLVYCSHAGAILALDAVTGRRLWVVRYPSHGQKMSDGSLSARDLAPAVYAAGYLYVAPADYDRILKLEASSGRKVWESEPLERTVHLVGVTAQGRLIVTTLDDIRSLDASTGRTLRNWISPGAGGRLPPLGRGLLAGNLVLWPTMAGLRALDQESGDPVEDMACNYTPNTIHGNLALGEGCLVVADATHIHAYVAPRWFLEQRQRASAQQRAVVPRFELALAEADAGLFEPAVRDFAYVERTAAAREVWQGQPLQGLARSRRHALLLNWAAQEKHARRWNEAAVHLTQAAADDFTVPQRLKAWVRQAALWTSAERPERVADAWQQILEDDQLRRGTWDDAEAEVTVTAGAFATQRMADLVNSHGPKVYQTIEQRAAGLFASAKATSRPDRILQLAARFPNAQATVDTLGELAAAPASRPAVAAQAYRLLLHRKLSNGARGAALAGLASAYAKEGCRDAPGPCCLLPPLVCASQYILQGGGGDAPVESMPHLLVPRIDRPFAALGRLFFLAGLSEKPTLVCRDAVNGKLRWEQALPFKPDSIDRHADIIVVAGKWGASGLSLDDGTTLWEFVAAKPLDRGSWQLSAGRLFIVEDQRRLMSLDVEDGTLLWSRWAPGARLQSYKPVGRFHPFFRATEEYVIIQVSGGQACIFDSRTGRKLREVVTAVVPWARPPFVLSAGAVCMVPDDSRLTRLDLNDGKERWTQALPRPSSSMEAPQLAFDGSISLLALIDGWQLEARDAHTGKLRWLAAEPRWAANRPHEPWQPVFQGEVAYFVRGDFLYAYALGDGKRLWERSLGVREDAWRTVATAGYVLVFPTELKRRPRLPWKGTGPPFPGSEPNLSLTFPVLIFNEKDGKIVQRLDFPLDDTDMSVQILAGGAVVAGSGMVRWLTSERRE